MSQSSLHDDAISPSQPTSGSSGFAVSTFLSIVLIALAISANSSGLISFDSDQLVYIGAPAITASLLFIDGAVISASNKSAQPEFLKQVFSLTVAYVIASTLFKQFNFNVDTIICTALCWRIIVWGNIKPAAYLFLLLPIGMLILIAHHLHFGGIVKLVPQFVILSGVWWLGQLARYGKKDQKLLFASLGLGSLATTYIGTLTPPHSALIWIIAATSVIFSNDVPILASIRLEETTFDFSWILLILAPVMIVVVHSHIPSWSIASDLIASAVALLVFSFVLNQLVLSSVNRFFLPKANTS